MKSTNKIRSCFLTIQIKQMKAPVKSDQGEKREKMKIYNQAEEKIYKLNYRRN